MFLTDRPRFSSPSLIQNLIMRSQHLQRIHSYLACPSCGQMCESLSHLTRHYQVSSSCRPRVQVEESEESDVEEIDPIQVCNNLIVSSRKVHLRAFQQPSSPQVYVACLPCELVINKAELQEHYKTSDMHPKCSICNHACENGKMFLEVMFRELLNMVYDSEHQYAARRSRTSEIVLL